MSRGFFLALEGIDGSGTTTQADRLTLRLRTQGFVVHRTAEPTSNPVGKLIRQAIIDATFLSDETIALLFAADRLDHWPREIEPTLSRGGVVISDRYLMSSLAYQASDLPLDWVAEINARAHPPHASVLLRVSAETAERRRAARGGKPERFDATERQRRIAAAYEAALSRPGVGEVHVIDGEQPMEAVGADLDALIDRLVGEASCQGRLSRA